MKRKSILKDISSNYLKHTKSESGITLIALVVTIVVLLILAGVTIECTYSQNGEEKSVPNGSKLSVGGKWNINTSQKSKI